MSRNRVRFAECLLLFVGVPALLTLWRAFPEIPASSFGVDAEGAVRLSRTVVTATLFIALAGVIVALLRDKSVDRRTLFRVRPSVPGRSFLNELSRILAIWLTAAVCLAFIVARIHPDWFLLLPRDRPTLWVLIALLYPIFSVIPQGLIYRCFFMQRYEAVFGRWTPIAAALAFSGMHAVFLNWVAPLLCLAGGALFVWTYIRTRSAFLAWLEHSLHGVTAFSLGLGLYFFLGAPRDENGRLVPPIRQMQAETEAAPTVGAPSTPPLEHRP